MSATFPSTLVGYEIAVMEALRRELGADLDRMALPNGRDLGEAFFRRTPPLDFAWQWLQEHPAGKSRSSSAPSSSSASDGTLPLL